MDTSETEHFFHSFLESLLTSACITMEEGVFDITNPSTLESFGPGWDSGIFSFKRGREPESVPDPGEYSNPVQISKRVRIESNPNKKEHGVSLPPAPPPVAKPESDSAMQVGEP